MKGNGQASFRSQLTRRTHDALPIELGVAAQALRHAVLPSETGVSCRVDGLAENVLTIECVQHRRRKILVRESASPALSSFAVPCE